MKYLAEYGYRIKEAVLLDYLRKTTKFQERQIKKFLDLITNRKNENNLYNRFNSWRKKLIYIGGYYYLALIPLLNCNICQLSEYWLEKCDLPMSKRGHEFEHYCKKKFQDSHKGILQKAIIDERTKYKVADIEEEIDLVMIIDNYIIIGEMKALAYPMDIIRWHNAYQELKKGIDQVRRKSHFLSENRHELLMKYSDYEGKRIVPVVITNYPLHSPTSKYNKRQITICFTCPNFHLLRCRDGEFSAMGSEFSLTCHWHISHLT